MLISWFDSCLLFVPRARNSFALLFQTIHPFCRRHRLTCMRIFFNLHTCWYFIFSFCSLVCAKEKLEINDKVNSVYHSIVRIEVVSERGSNGRMLKSGSTGSGVIIDQSGLVVTNHHVAGKATRLSCRLHNGEEISADLLGADALTDLAVLRLRLSERLQGSPPISYSEFGNSDAVKVGDICFAMGSPAGLSQSVTRGIISNLALISRQSGSFRLDGENVGELVRWLGHDAVIFPGNSGGPLVDENGLIIGINEVAIASLGGAIPSNLVQDIAKELATKGHIERSWYGFECQPLLNENEKGILISGIIEGSPAMQAGLMPGDLITHFAGEPVDARIAEDIPPFNQLTSSIPAGRKIKIKGIRDAKEIIWELTTKEREPAFHPEKEVRSWGLTLRDFTMMSSLESRRDNLQGAQVHTVAPGGPSYSAKPSLLPGDVIVEANRLPISSVKDLLMASKELTDGKKEPTPVLVRFERDLASYLTVIKIGPDPEENRPMEAWKPWLGVRTQVLTRDLAEALGLESNVRGIRISQVFPDTPAARAGISAGDLLFRVDGQIIQANKPEDYEVFGNMIKQYKTDSTISLSGKRADKEEQWTVTLDKRPTPSQELPEYEDESLELTVRELSFSDRIFQRLNDDQDALFVENVEPAGWSSLAGLRQGDLLLTVNGNAVGTVDDFVQEINACSKENSPHVIFFIKRGIHTLFIKVEPNWDPS